MRYLFIVVGVLLIGAGCGTSTQMHLSDLTTVFDDQYEMPRGEGDETFTVLTYEVDDAYEGTTVFPDLSNEDHPRIVEVNMLGEVVWSYEIPDQFSAFTEPGMDVEYLYESDHFLIVLPKYGVIEIDRDGEIVWQHLDEQISHDADRLENGNTIYAWGANDMKGEDVVKEVDPEGSVVWAWSADMYWDDYSDVFRGGWTHANAVQRLEDGTTMISLRNFDMTVIVDENGEVIWEYVWSRLGKDPHEPEIRENGNILICLQGETSYQALEMTLDGEIIWSFYEEDLRTARDCDRLPNGNTLIQAVDGDEKTVLIELTAGGEEVWRFTYSEALTEKAGLIYKAERIRYE